jgi:hypothetical protein
MAGKKSFLSEMLKLAAICTALIIILYLLKTLVG